MDFFKSIINDTYDALDKLPKMQYDLTAPWKDAGSGQIVLLRDTHAELNGIGYNVITSDDTTDSIVVIGDDIKSLKDKRNFARIAVIQIEDVADEQRNYDLIKKIEYTKYHAFPDGYMVRASSRSQNESVRISKASVKNGIDFQKVGSLFISKYKENPSVKAVKIYFVTDEKADFSALRSLAEKNKSITETLNHVINSVNFDCNVCNLKPICDEVEGMRELHFKNKSM